MKRSQPFPYQILVNFSPEDEGFIARVPALKHCSAFGETAAKAVAEAEVAAKLWLEAAKANNIDIPAPGVDVAGLLAMSRYVNISEIARMAGISSQTLHSKVKRLTALANKESHAIGNVLLTAGLLPIENFGHGLTIQHGDGDTISFIGSAGTKLTLGGSATHASEITGSSKMKDYHIDTVHSFSGRSVAKVRNRSERTVVKAH